MTPCVRDRTRICTPSSCYLKKVRLVPLTAQDEWTIQTPLIIKGETSPVDGWNVVRWAKDMPDVATCFGFSTETQAIRSFNTVTKMTSTLAACLRDKVVVRKSYVWML